jgi:hypothetical protein
MDGRPCELAHHFDILGISHLVKKRSHIGQFFLSQKLAHRRTVRLVPVFGSGGSCCFAFLDLGLGRLAAALRFQSVQVESMVNCL